MSSACHLCVVHMSSAHRTHKTSVPRLFQVKQQRTALLKIKNKKALFSNIQIKTRMLISSVTPMNHYYRLLRSCRKVMLSKASVILFTGGVCVWQTPPWADTPYPVHAGIHPPSGHCSRWYASHWNAFLLIMHSCHS